MKKKTTAALYFSMLTALTFQPYKVVAADYSDNKQENSYSVGDVNLDDSVNIADAVLLQKYLLGSGQLDEEQYRCADINGDNAVNSFDMILLRKMFIEESDLIDSGNCGESAKWKLKSVDSDTDDALSLTISGSGAVEDYRYGNSPWYDHHKNITDVVISPGIEELGMFTCYGLNLVEEIELPDSVKSIGISAFMYCSSLKKITIPDSVTEIGFSAFEWCSSLASISLPEKITKIETLTFAACEQLREVYIPAGVTEIGKSAFAGCNSLKDVYFGGTEAQWSEISIADDNASLGRCTVHFNANNLPA